MTRQRTTIRFTAMTVALLLFMRFSTLEVLAQAEQWITYSDPVYRFTTEYPANWQLGITLTNQDGTPGVIEQRLLFKGQYAGVNIDIFPNPDEKDLESWYEAHQSHFIPPAGLVQRGLSVAGQKALYALDPGNGQFPARHTVILLYSDYVYRIEYQASDDGVSLGTYRTMLDSLRFSDTKARGNELFDVTEMARRSIIPKDQNCCGYTDPNPNPYPCYEGNCTWWARYKRPDTGGQAYPYWNDALNWTSRAYEEGFSVNGTPSTGAIGGTPRSGYVRPGWENHVAYVESFDGSTARFSDMDGGAYDCSVDYWDQTSWVGIEFIHPRGDVCCGCLPASCCSTARAQASNLLTTNVSREPRAFSSAKLWDSTAAVTCQTERSEGGAPLAERNVESGTSGEAAFVGAEPSITAEAPPYEPVEVLTADAVPMDPLPNEALPLREAVEPERIPPTSANYSIVKSVFGSGGGPKTSAHYVMNSTQGQPTDLSRRTSASYVLVPGYWGPWKPVTLEYGVYLPLVVGNR